jgi:ABC-type nitrate/sulfonate/bicarbonate transport system substrate-binding protein
MRKLIARLALLVATLQVAGFAGAARAEDLREMSYVYATPTSYYWEIFVAQEMGFMTQEGVKLNAIMSDNVAQQIQMLVTGAADVAGANAEVALVAMEKGAPLSIVGAETAKQGFVFMVRPEIKTYADLKGKLLGATQLQDASATMLKELLRKNGVEPGSYDLIALGGTPNRFAALNNGAVAGTLLSPPLDYKALSVGMRKLGYAWEAFSGPQVVFTVQKDWAKKNEETLVRFLRAANRGMAFLYDPKNREKAADILVKSIGGTREDALKNYDDWFGPNKVMAENLAIQPSDLQGFLDLRGSKVDPASFLDLSYLTKALAH